MVGVCDGHGVNGHLVSNFVKINLPKLLTETIWSQVGAYGLDNDKLNTFLPPLSSNAVGSSFANFSRKALNDEYSLQNPIQSENEAGHVQQSLLAESWFA